MTIKNENNMQDYATRNFLPRYKRRKIKRDLVIVLLFTAALLGSMYLETSFVEIDAGHYQRFEELKEIYVIQ